MKYAWALATGIQALTSRVMLSGNTNYAPANAGRRTVLYGNMASADRFDWSIPCPKVPRPYVSNASLTAIHRLGRPRRRFLASSVTDGPCRADQTAPSQTEGGYEGPFCRLAGLGSRVLFLGLAVEEQPSRVVWSLRSAFAGVFPSFGVSRGRMTKGSRHREQASHKAANIAP